METRETAQVPAPVTAGVLSIVGFRHESVCFDPPVTIPSSQSVTTLGNSFNESMLWDLKKNKTK